MSEHVHSIVIFVFSTSTNKHIATEKKKKFLNFYAAFFTVANWNCCLEEGCLSCVYKYSYLCSHWYESIYKSRMHFTLLIKNYIFKEISSVNPWPWIINTTFPKLSTITGVTWIIWCNKAYCKRVYTFTSRYIPAVRHKYFIPWWKHGILSWVIRSNKCSCHKIGVVSWRAQQTSWSI